MVELSNNAVVPVTLNDDNFIVISKGIIEYFFFSLNALNIQENYLLSEVRNFICFKKFQILVS